MSMNWTREKPNAPGWYWCRNSGDRKGEVWEAVVRMDATDSGLICSWMTAPGEADTMHESNFAPDCFWAGPLAAPESQPIVAYIVMRRITKLEKPD